MKMRKRKIDYLRILAIIMVFLGIAYFYVTLFAPQFMPFYLRLGMPMRPINILIMGTDFVFDRETHKIISEGGHNDTIVLAHIDPKAGKINLLSIPRDTLAEIPEYGRTKINTAHIIGGPELAGTTVKNLLGIPIDRYAVINPRGIIRLIDLLGGIRIYVDKDMHYVDKAGNLYINLSKGWHNLSGEEANGYLRFRMDPLGDINRVQRQQGFIGALLKKFANPANIWRIPLVTQVATENIKTDLSLNEIFRIGNLVRCLTKDDLRTILLPGNFSVESDKPCFWIADTEETEKILSKYFAKTIKTPKTSDLKPAFYVSIFNNSGDKNVPYSILKKLSKTKYVISNISSIERGDYVKTHIIAQKGNIAGAKALGKLLKIDEVTISGAGDIISDYTVIICKDYKNMVKSSL